jgi:hypothetical protein
MATVIKNGGGLFAAKTCKKRCVAVGNLMCAVQFNAFRLNDQYLFIMLHIF